MSERDYYHDCEGPTCGLGGLILVMVLATAVIIIVMIFEAQRDTTADINRAVQQIGDACQLGER